MSAKSELETVAVKTLKQRSEVSERYVGRCKWFLGRKGYGFLSRASDGKDFFVHHSAIKTEMSFKCLQEGQIVEFSIVKDPRGRDCAGDVVIIKTEKSDLQEAVHGETD